MKTLLTMTLLLALTLALGVAGPSRQPLSALLGQWKGSAKMYDTKFSKAQTIASTADCAWTPQGTALVCETLVEDPQGKHVQLSIDTPDAEGSGYSYYTVMPGQRPYAGDLLTNGNTWTYNPPPEAARKYPVFRTINTFSGETETFKTEFSEDGTAWTTMLEGSQHRVTTK